MIRKLLAVLAAFTLMVGLAPAATAQTNNTVRIGDFAFKATINSGGSDLRPGGHVRIDLTATNSYGTCERRLGVCIPWTDNRMLHTYGFTVPAGYTLRASGGEHMSNVGDHEQLNFFGGQPSNIAMRTVQKGSSRSGWLSFNIPADAAGGSKNSFGVKASLEGVSGGTWFPTYENVVSFTLGSVATTTTVTADPAAVEEGGKTTLTASVAATAGSNKVTAGDIEFRVNGTAIGRMPVDANGRASIEHTVPLLDNRTPVTQQVTARYVGDSPRFAASTSAATAVTVNPEPRAEVTSTVGLTATRGLVENGQLPVTLDVTVDTSNGQDLPAGAQVEIVRDDVVVATIPVAGVTATYTDHLDAEVAESSSYRYTARLLKSESDDTIYLGAESEPVTVTLAAEVTPEVTVAVDPTSVLVGRAVVVTATVTDGGDPLPAGAEVIIRANGRDIGTVTTGDDGTAVLTGHEFTTPGDKTIEAVFGGAVIGGKNYRPVTSAPATLTVEALPEADSATVIDLRTEATAGDEVTITAVITRPDGGELTDAAAADLGSVWFYSDGEVIGSAPVTMDPATGETTAVFTYRFAERGEYRVTAEYSGTRGTDEVIAPSETDSATVITVTAGEIVIEEPGPPAPNPIMIGSLDMGSIEGVLGEEGLSSLTGMFGGN
ncbi:Ig-like domain-containing protein [Dietzia kunjamensis]|uniref:Ig-like domain-containing protein n=1 Tax=Dietzia kunjamensis TaxID=322509 RepID=UPI0039BCF152